MSHLVFDYVSHSYDGTPALRGLNVDVEPGDCLALVGPSGCGKSTALRIASGLQFPEHGRVWCDGEDITHVPTYRRRFGMVTQQNALTPYRTAAAHIALPLKLRGQHLSELDARVEAEAHQFSIAHLLGRYRRQLSGGETQAVQLARALVARPRVLLLDEPLARIDLDLRLKLRGDIARVRREYGVTTLLVTADQEDAMVLADRIAVLDRGQIQQVGHPMDVYHRPVNVMVARFLGEPAMTLFEAPVELIDGQRSYLVGTGRFPAHPPIADRFLGDRALLGVRPEAVRLTPPGSGGSTLHPPLRGRVERTEIRGTSTVVHLTVETDDRCDLELTALAHGIGPRPGDPVGVVLDPARFHLFDRFTEAALHHPA